MLESRERKKQTKPNLCSTSRKTMTARTQHTGSENCTVSYVVWMIVMIVDDDAIAVLLMAGTMRKVKVKLCARGGIF